MTARGARLGAFRLRRLLGRGGMGEVWEGEHVGTGARVAIKLVNDSLAALPPFREAFQREVQAVARLSHPGVVTVLDYGVVTERSTPYLVMELLEGGSLRQNAPATWDDLRELLLHLLSALAYAHARGVVHRDIKRGNVVFATPRAQSSARLIDFGIAAATQLGDDEPSSTVVGTPAYMAPEQVLGSSRDQGPWTDLYALGCLAHQLACGRAPFTGSSEEILRAQLDAPFPRLSPMFPVPDGLEDWIRIATAKRPSDRFTYAADAAHALRELERTPPGIEIPQSLSERDVRYVMEGPTLSDDVDTDRDPTVLEPELQVFASGGRPSPPRAPPIERRLEDAEVAGGQPGIHGAGLGLWGLRDVPLVARTTERQELWAALADVASDGRTRAVVLRGAAGTGKSRLARWLTELAHERGAAEILRAVHGPVPGAVDGVGAMLARYFRCAGLRREDAVSRIRDRLLEHGATSQDEWLPIGDLVAPRMREGISSIRFGINQLHAAVVGCLARLASTRPVIVWIDDAQWGSMATELAAYALRRGRPERPILFVLTVREDALDREGRLERALNELESSEGVSVMRIAPLDSAAHAELVTRLAPLEGDAARRVVRRTHGNPLFAVHVIGQWIQRGDLVPTERGLTLREEAEPSLPDDLHDVWSAIVDELLARRPIEERIAVELGAVLGQDVSLEEWRELCRRASASASDDLIEELVRRRLAMRTDLGLSFVHGMIRESIERSAAEAGRAAMHHRASAELLRLRTDTPGVAARIGRHLLLAGLDEEALRPLLRGASESWRHGDLRDVLALLDMHDEALHRARIPDHDVRRGESRLLRARAQKSFGDFSKVGELAESLVEDARAHGWTSILPHALHMLGTRAQALGRVDELASLNEQALELLADGDLHGRIDVLWALGWVARYRGQMERAEELLTAALSLAQSLDDEREAAECHRGLAQIALRRSDLAGARAHELEAIAGYEATGDSMGLVYAHNGLGEVARHAGDLEAAEAAYRHAAALGERVGSTEAAVPRLNLGYVLLGRERWDEAEAYLSAAGETLIAGERLVVGAVAEAGLMVVAAARSDEGAWRVRSERFARLLETVEVVERDVALALTQAGEIWEGQGVTARALWCPRHARAQWEGLGATTERSATDEAIRRLEAS